MSFPRRGLGLAALIWLTTAVLGAGPAAQEESEDLTPGREQYIVCFRPELNWQEREEVVRQAGGRLVRRLDLIDALAASFPASDAQKALRKLLGMPGVVRVDEDGILWAIEGPARVVDIPLPTLDTFLGMGTASQEVPWGVRRVRAPGAWGRTRGQGVKVAIVDTGIDPNHAELRVAGGVDIFNLKKESWKDDHGHGTHVAGIVAALDNDHGVVGVAPGAELYAVKVLNRWGWGTFSTLIKGLEWCVRNGIEVANMSLGGNAGNESLKQAVQKAHGAGLTMVAAAGNSEKVEYPAVYEEVLALSASNEKDGIAGFSSRGPEVDFIAPGTGVRSTWKGGGYKKASGTSMSSPHAAGLAALAVALGAAGPEGVRAALRKAAEPLPKLTPKEQGAGMINAEKL